MNNTIILENLLAQLDAFEAVKPDEIPNIDLYMDQVTTFMDHHLEEYKRYADDKILTKTMINNYAKNNLLPPPNKKKYSKDHMLLLIFIYYFKNLLSFNDIETLFKPITDKYFSGSEEIQLQSIYEEVFSMEREQMSRLKADITAKYTASSNTFLEAKEEDRDYLQLFSFVCTLGFDVYLKKQMLESIIDDLRPLKNGKKEK